MRKIEQQASELSREKEADCSAKNGAASIRVERGEGGGLQCGKQISKHQS